MSTELRMVWKREREREREKEKREICRGIWLNKILPIWLFYLIRYKVYLITISFIRKQENIDIINISFYIVC